MNAYACHGGGHSILNIYDMCVCVCVCVCVCMVIIIVLERQDLASVGPCYTHITYLGIIILPGGRAMYWGEGNHPFWCNRSSCQKKKILASAVIQLKGVGHIVEPLNNRHVDVGEVVSSEVRELVHQSFIRSSTVHHSEWKMEFLLKV